MPNDLMKLVASVLAQKRALDQKERQLIDSLNRVLPGMGYHVVPMSDGTGAARAARRQRPARSTGSGAAAAVKPLVCSQCGRRFSHPLHLGRHAAAMHKGASAKPTRGRRKTRRTRRTRKTAR